MLKKLSFVLFVTLSSGIAFAQKNVQFGVKAGLNIASLRDDLVEDAKATPRKGVHAGFLAHIHLNRHWAIQPEVTYSTQGANYDYGTFTGKDKFDYINVPVLVQYLTKGGLRIQTGPQLGYMVSGTFKPNNGPEVNKTDIKSTDFSWAFGLGYITKSGFGIDGRYNLGVSNLYKDGVHAASAKAANHVGQIGIFYQFKH